MLAVLILLFASSSASAADFTVTRDDDPTPGACDPSDCSLREAANAADAAPGRQVIDVPDGMIVTLTQGPLHITGDVTIAGHGPGTSITATVNSQIVVIDSGGDAIIQDIKIKNAAVTDVLCGGGVYNQGTVQLLRVNVEGNSMNGNGAGICNLGTADVNASTVLANHADGGPGGGIYNSGTMTIESSAINGNSVAGTDGGGDGAGIENAEGGTLTIDYSSIGGNLSSSPVCNDCSSGAGIRSDGTLTLDHSTVSGNHADNTAAIQNSGMATISNSTISGNDAGSITNEPQGVLTVANSTVSGNQGLPYPKQGYGGLGNYATLTVARSTVVDNTASGYDYGGFYASNNSLQIVLVGDLIVNNGVQNCSNGGNVVSQGGNVVTDDSCRSLGNDHVISTDPMIGPLANNGGTTLTRALLSGSPAIDAGSNFQCSFDQRGAPRPVGGTCDAGSFEFGSNAPTLSPSPSPTAAPIAYPMGDADCNDRVDVNDIPAELRLASKLDAPSDCGRSTIPCMTFEGACYPVWTNPDCNDAIDGADVLPILMFLIDQPLTEPCTQVGQYPIG
jgi:hypothetical protein